MSFLILLSHVLYAWFTFCTFSLPLFRWSLLECDISPLFLRIQPQSIRIFIPCPSRSSTFLPVRLSVLSSSCGFLLIKMSLSSHITPSLINPSPHPHRRHQHSVKCLHKTFKPLFIPRLWFDFNLGSFLFFCRTESPDPFASMSLSWVYGMSVHVPH